MDYSNIEQKYKTELALLKSKKTDLTNSLEEFRTSLGLTEEEFTIENLETLLKEKEGQLDELKATIEALIKEYESL